VARALESRTKCSLIWAMMPGFAICGDIPSVSLAISGAIVAGSGLFLLAGDAVPVVWPETRVGCVALGFCWSQNPRDPIATWAS